ncbi:MAG TPA: LCP family protein, partial [Bacillota bacterium]|nr:LCP family protein [Bacillota bacterium]
MNSRIEKRQNKKKRKGLYWIGGIILLLLLLVAGYLFYLYNKIDDTVDVMHNPLERDEDPDRQKELKAIFKDKKAINILLLGVDEREGDRGRSDTIILMSMNPKTNSMKMLSVPRDTYVNIPGRGNDKINHAYAFGDVELSIQTFEEAFDIPVHFYARINMEGFQEGIDALGGVTVQNNLDFSQDGVHF